MILWMLRPYLLPRKGRRDLPVIYRLESRLGVGLWVNSEQLEELDERYGLTATQVLGGAHDLAAQAEENEAARRDKISQWSMWIAVAIAAIAQMSWYVGWTPDWTEWFDPLRSLPLIGSPVVILLFVAKREGRVAAEHRARHERLQSLSLQFRSWEPYLSTLSEEVRPQMERQVTPRLFPGDAVSSEPSPP